MLSVVTATYNSQRDIPALIASLQAQTFQDFEWVVQDGGSSDGTVDIVTATDLPYLSVESARDTGIYDALNHALDRATGRYLLFIGADDCISDVTVFQRLADAINSDGTEPAIVLGAVRTGDEAAFTSRLGRITLAINSVHHQGALYHRSLFDEFRYDLTIPVIADYELNLLLHLRQATTLNSGILIAQCGPDGISHTADEGQLYQGMHVLRSKHMNSAASFALYTVAMANVWRRRLRRRSAARA